MQNQHPTKTLQTSRRIRANKDLPVTLPGRIKGPGSRRPRRNAIQRLCGRHRNLMLRQAIALHVVGGQGDWVLEVEEQLGTQVGRKRVYED